MAVWFIARWTFFIGLYLMAFVIGGMDGPIIERIKNFPLPQLQLKNWPPGRGPISTYGFNPPYYTVLTQAFLTPAEASSQQSRLASSRIKSHVIIQNARYYVCVGNFQSEKEAATTFAKVRNKGYINSIVVGPVQ
jgi:hypothetical protein